MPPRPLRNSQALRDAVVAELLPEVMRWIDDDPISQQEAEITISHAISSLRILDGYKLAKWIEGHNLGWQPDADLVGILNEARDFKEKAYTDQVRTWAAENMIKPALAINTHVDMMIHGHGRKRGVIVAIKSDVAQYAVSIPDMGQTYDHETRTGEYYIVDYEVLEAEQVSNSDAKEEESNVQF